MPDRTYDLSAWRGQDPTRLVPLTADLAGPGESGTVCTGIQKLAQWFLIEFLTPMGSCLYDPTRGTKFITLVRQGRLRTDLDVNAAAGFAIGDIQARAQKVEDPAAPADERLADAEVTKVILAGDHLTLGILLHSRAGDSREVILPVATTP